jgi:hypothetical protein
LPRLEEWELLGQLLCAGGSTFGLIYGTASLANLAVTFRGAIALTVSSEASLGLAGLALSSFGSFSTIIVGQLRPPEGNVGVLLVFWTNFAVLLIGDILFYALQPSATTVMLVGLFSAALTAGGLLVTAQRPARR